ncbi:MAG: winged helix-turn-helix transcriptional regulator [Actinomycetota bacterium]|nr:winged helix-turn-helix transcriptional regulator [Actinomycetota bacterium]
MTGIPAATGLRSGTHPGHRAGVPVGHENDERTKDRVLSAVLEHGPVSAAQLGTLLGLTPAAVRRHLDILSRDGVIEVKLISNSRTGAGRPARRYVLSKRGQSELGDDYLEIARTALSQLAEIGGEAAIREFAANRFAQMERRYLPVVEQAGSDVAERSRALAGALSADGYVASSASVNGAVSNSAVNSAGVKSTSALSAEQLCQGHCPVQELATEFPQFCEAETKVFSRLLGVDVRRLSTLASGGHVCTTHIPTGRAAVPVRVATTTKAETAAPTEIEVSNHQQERP